MKKQIVSFLCTLSLISCTSINSSDTGSIKMDFKFPKSNSFSIKAVPENTDSFQVSISGDGLSQSIEKKITKDSSGKVLIQAIPTGNKTVTVKAINSSGKVLAQASANTEIKTGEVNRVTMELKSLFKNFTLNFTNLSSIPSNTYAEFKTKSDTIQQELKSNIVELKDIEPGDLNVKVVSYSDDATPLLNINKTINTTNTSSEEITLENIVLPKISDVDPINPFSGQLFQLLNNLKIDFKNNNQPQINGVELLVNNKSVNPSYISINPTCINMSDNIKFNANFVDKDNDKVNFYWARNSSTKEGYKLSLYDERGSSLNINANELGFGNYSIGLLATDKKAFVNSGSIYFNVREKCN